MSSFYIKRNDRLPVIQATLSNADGAINLTGATVYFCMTKAGEEEGIRELCTIVTAASGIVKYEWADGDTEEEGTYHAEFEIVFASGLRLTVPNDDTKIVVRITADIGQE